MERIKEEKEEDEKGFGRYEHAPALYLSCSKCRVICSNHVTWMKFRNMKDLDWVWICPIIQPETTYVNVSKVVTKKSYS